MIKFTKILPNLWRLLYPYRYYTRHFMAGINKLADTQKATAQTMTVDTLVSKKEIKRFKKT